MNGNGPGKIVSGFFALVAASLLSAALAALIAVGPPVPLDGGQPAQAAHEGGTVDLVALDMNPSGNTIADPPSGNVEETTLGPVESCIEVTHPATFGVDAVVSGYPPDTDSLVAYDIKVTFPQGLQLTDSITGHIPQVERTLISADPQSVSLFALTVDEPNYGGGAPLTGPAEHSAVVLDLARGDDQDESVDGEENSDGYLVRYTFQTTAPGPAELPVTLSTGTNFVLDDVEGVPFTAVQNGIVAVDMGCAGLTPPSWPTTTETAGVTAQGQTPAAGDGGTSDADGDGAPASGDDGTPAAGADGTPPTGADGTPAAGDVVTPAGGGQTAGKDDSDGGIGTWGWIGIGVGIGAAALAVTAAAAWMIRARARREA